MASFILNAGPAGQGGDLGVRRRLRGAVRRATGGVGGHWRGGCRPRLCGRCGGHRGGGCRWERVGGGGSVGGGGPLAGEDGQGVLAVEVEDGEAVPQAWELRGGGGGGRKEPLHVLHALVNVPHMPRLGGALEDELLVLLLRRLPLLELEVRGHGLRLQ